MAPETWKYMGGEGGEHIPHEISTPGQQGKKRLSDRPPSLAPNPQDLLLLLRARS